MPKSRRHFRNILIVVLILIVCGIAFAFNAFGLRSRVVDSRNYAAIIATLEIQVNTLFAENAWLSTELTDLYYRLRPSPEEIANLAVTQLEDELWRNYLATWEAMDPVQVARIIETMLTTDMPLIVRVMAELPEAFRGDVLNNLDAEAAGAVLRHMEP